LKNFYVNTLKLNAPVFGKKESVITLIILGIVEMAVLTLARKFCGTFQDRAKGRELKNVLDMILLMRELQADFPFTGRHIIWKDEVIGVEFVFADKSTCSAFYDRPGQLSVEPLAYKKPGIFT